MTSRFLLLLALLSTSAVSSRADQHALKSPDGKISVTIDLSSTIYYSVNVGDIPLLKPSPLSLVLGDGSVLGAKPKLLDSKYTEQRGQFTLPVGRRKVVPDNFNELELKFAGDFSVVFRAYDDGVAYRFRTSRPGDMIIRSELLQWNLASASPVWRTDYNSMSKSFEEIYTKVSFSDWKAGSYAYSPIMLEHPDGPRVVLCDADLSDYPGLYLGKGPDGSRFEIDGLFPKYPKATLDTNWNHFDRTVTETQDYIAKTEGTRDFPWRVTLIAGSDRELLDSNLVTKLARPLQLADTSWLRPGLASWDWWNDWNLEGMDFRTGINTRTYFKYVDFAAENKLPYLVVDEGWSSAYDLGVPNPDLDMPALVKYAREKGVKLVLWCLWKTLDDQWDTAFAQFSKWGIAGIKVDFFDRDDQVAIADVERIAKETASRHMFCDFHGCRPLPGFTRTYPNVFGFEGVRGNEYNKFSKEPPYPAYNVTLPFTRGLMGPMDYTPGAMRNVLASEFAVSNSNPEAIGTRCQQLAMYVLYDAPIQMMSDSPTAYRKAPDFLAVMSGIPTTWDDTRGLESRTGEYAMVARRSGDQWYVAAMAGTDARKLPVDLGFLAPGRYRATLVEDGVNADRLPTDYRVLTVELDTSKPFGFNLAPGGGAVLRIDQKLP
jgi:alpha-glucosidase